MTWINAYDDWRSRMLDDHLKPLAYTILVGLIIFTIVAFVLACVGW